MIRLLQEEEYVDWEDRMWNYYIESLTDAEREAEDLTSRFYNTFSHLEFTYGMDMYGVFEACDTAKSLIFAVLRKLREDYKVLPIKKVEPATAEKEDTTTDLYLEADMAVDFDNNDIINSRLLDKIAQIIKSRYKEVKIKKKGSAEIIVDLGTYAGFECEFYIVIRSSKQIEFLYSAHYDKTRYAPKEDNDEYADEYD